MPHNPLISILICNYNYGRFVEEALDSVLAQSYSNTEIVIIDDGSTDNSLRVIEAYKKRHPEKNIRLKAKKKNQGICYARSDALKLAEGEYILFLDSDDTIPSNYLSNLYEVLIKQTADIVYCDLQNFGDESNKVIFPDFDLEELLIHNYIHISALAKRSKIKNQTFDAELNRKTLEDYDFWLGLALEGLKFVKAKNVFLNYRVQKQSRNDNLSNLEIRILNFLETWNYIISKYKKQYPTKIRDDITYKELRFQVGQICKELDDLNTIVQKQLLPELQKRERHLEHREKVLQEYVRQNKNLWEQNVQHKDAYTKVQNSLDYKIGRVILKPARVISHLVKRG